MQNCFQSAQGRTKARIPEVQCFINVFTQFGRGFEGYSPLENLPGDPDANITVLRFHTCLLSSVLVLLLGC